MKVLRAPASRRSSDAARPPSLRGCCAAFALASLLACGGESGPDVSLPDADSRRDPAAGALVGYRGNSGTHVWKGIPFAQAPVGALRWRAPRVLSPWQGLREAVQAGSACAQRPSALNGGDADALYVGSEDCLYLNVYAPAFSPADVPTGSERLPVMVWIHGGANLLGQGDVYDGSALVNRHDVIFVSLNYRLGVFGWFRHPALAVDADVLDASGNFGTLDLVRGLEWVRDHIAAFGGDPGNVTVFGESAGALDVITLLLSPQAEGLFDRAIAQSGGSWSASVAEAENWSDAPEPGLPYSSREILARLLLGEDRAADRDEARRLLENWSEQQTAAYLRARSSAQIMAIFADDERLAMNELPLVVREGTVLPVDEFHAVFARGDYHRVPTILGTNRDESKLFLSFSPDYVRRWLGFYPQVRDPARYERDAEYGSRIWKADGADEIAIAMRPHQGPRIFVYRFDWDEEPSLYGVDMARLLGAAHAFEIPFVLGDWNLRAITRYLASEENRTSRLALSGAMMSYWAEHAYRGSPGRGRDGTLPDWKAWSNAGKTAPRFLVLDTERGGGIRMSADAQTRERILADLARDPRFTPGELCERLRDFAEDSPNFEKEELAEFGC